MLKFLSVSSSQIFLNSIGQLLEVISTRMGMPESRCLSLSFNPRADENDTDRLAEFERLFCAVDSSLQEHDPVHDRFVGIIDCGKAKNAWGIHALTSIPGMMILTFPEIQWIPVYNDGTIGSSTLGLRRAIELCLGGYSPLFDGDGLRGILLNRIRNGYGKSDLRRDVAFAIDEEPYFAFINIYTAFRFGYRGFPVTTARCAEELLTAPASDSGVNPIREKIPCAAEFDETKEGTGHQVNSVVVFEDICLRFPDRNEEYSKEIAFGDKRDRYFRLISDADLRIVTTAAQPGEKNAVWHEKKITLESYFRKAGIGSMPYRNVIASYGGEMKQIVRILKRRLFNYTGGKWIGYWLKNLIELMVYLSLGIVFFVYKPSCIFILLLFLFLRFSIVNWLNDNLKLDRFPYVVKYRQWAFMPKCYVNHDPVWNNSEKGRDRNCRFWDVARKPLAGIFGLRNKCGLPNGKNCPAVYSTDFVVNFYRQVIRTGQFADNPKNKREGSGHAAPGVALEIATRLIRRAENMKEKVLDVESAIYAAVLADVALELLDNKTPAVSMEAVYWKHHYEIVAECEFVGVRAHLDMKDRYIDIHNAIGRICRADNNRVRNTIFLSGMAEIAEKISNLLYDKGKLEEAAYFTTHSRRLHRKLLSPAMRTLMAYPEWALRSTWNFMFSFGGFFLLFFLYWKYTFDQPFLTALTSTFKVMVARNMETPPIETDQTRFIIMMACQIAGLHLCFVAAHFLMFMNRK